jgi:hypothetical protein
MRHLFKNLRNIQEIRNGEISHNLHHRKTTSN